VTAVTIRMALRQDQRFTKLSKKIARIRRVAPKEWEQLIEHCTLLSENQENDYDELVDSLLKEIENIEVIHPVNTRFKLLQFINKISEVK